MNAYQRFAMTYCLEVQTIIFLQRMDMTIKANCPALPVLGLISIAANIDTIDVITPSNAIQLHTHVFKAANKRPVHIALYNMVTRKWILVHDKNANKPIIIQDGYMGKPLSIRLWNKIQVINNLTKAK